MIKICGLCNNEFEAIRKTQKYCKKTHYKECPVCKKVFLLKENRDTKTCSPSCGSSLTHTKEAKENRRLKSLERYGTEHPVQAEHIVKKIRKSLDNSENDARIGSKRWNKMMEEKFGVNNISQVEEIKKAKEQTYLRKFGVLNPAGMHVKNYEEWADFENFVKKVDWDCLRLADYFNVGLGTVRNVAVKTNTEEYIKGFYTYTESELKIKQLLNEIGLKEHLDFTHNDRSIIKPLEIDFYIERLNIGIEVSPTYTHNSKKGWAGKGEGLERNYHYYKLNKCKEKDLDLLTVFDWTDLNEIKRVILEKMNLQNELNDYSYIDNCEWNEKLKTSFHFNHNTYKGNKYKKVAIMNKKEIIALFVILENKNKSIIKDYKVLSGKHKVVLDFFINNYRENNSNVKKIKLTTNSSTFIQDNMLKDLGFKLSCNSNVRINYYNIKKKMHIKSLNTINKRKRLLEENNFLPVYDCGHKEWLMIL